MGSQVFRTLFYVVYLEFSYCNGYTEMTSANYDIVMTPVF